MQWTKTEGCRLMEYVRNFIDRVCLEKWGFEREACEGTPYRERKESHDEGTTICNEKADELATEGANVDGWQLAAARASTIKQLRKEYHVSFEYAAHFHMQVEKWKDRDESVPKEKEPWHFVQKKDRAENKGQKSAMTKLESTGA